MFVVIDQLDDSFILINFIVIDQLYSFLLDFLAVNYRMTRRSEIRTIIIRIVI